MSTKLDGWGWKPEVLPRDVIGRRSTVDEGAEPQTLLFEQGQRDYWDCVPYDHGWPVERCRGWVIAAREGAVTLKAWRPTLERLPATIGMLRDLRQMFALSTTKVRGERARDARDNLLTAIREILNRLSPAPTVGGSPNQLSQFTRASRAEDA